MTKKRKDAEQQDMFGHFNPRVGTMRKIREARRDAGFIEVTVWSPIEHREKIKEYAKQLLKNCGRDMPHSKS